MIYSACFLLLCLPPSRFLAGPKGFLLMAGLAAYALGVTYLYLTSKNAAFHEVGWATQIK